MGISLGLGLGLGGAGVGASVLQRATALKAALLAYDPQLLLLPDLGHYQDVSGYDRHPYASASLGAPVIEANVFDGHSAIDFTGSVAQRVPAFAGKHFIAVTQHDFIAWPDYLALYLSGSNGSFANYVFSGDSASGSKESWTRSDGWAGYVNKNFRQGVGTAGWSGAQQLSALNIYEATNTAATQIVTAHTLGESVGAASRTYRGKLFAFMAFPEILGSTDRSAVIELLRAHYQSPRIICIGDSLTRGVGGTVTPLENYGSAYPFQLRSLIGRDRINIWHSGYNGATISQIDGVADANCDSLIPDIIFVWAGTNNVGFTAGTATAAKADLDTLLTNRRAANPDALIYVLTLRPSTSAGSSNPANYNVQAPLLNTAIVGDATYSNGTRANGIIRIDQIPELADPSDVTYTADGLHLTDAGYALVAAACKAQAGL